MISTISRFDQKAFSSSVSAMKGLGIILVVLGHINSPLGGLIFSFHMPLFYFLAGFFVRPNQMFYDFLKKNIVRLMVPYFIFCSLGLLITILKNVIFHRPQESMANYLEGFLFWMDFSHLNHYGFVLWFLPALFWAKLMVYFLRKITHILWPAILVGCAFVCIFISKHTYGSMPFAIDKGLVAIPWVYIGSFFYVYREKLLPVKMLFVVLFSCPCLFVVWVFGVPVVDMANNNVGNFWLTFSYTLSVIGLLFVFLYCANVRQKRSLLLSLIVWFGSNSMLIFVFHPYTNNISNLIGVALFHEPAWGFTIVTSLLMLSIIVFFRERYEQSIFVRYV